MTAPLTDAGLEEIKARHERDTRALDNPVIALATSVAFDSAHADRNDLLQALAQCREEREALRQSRDWWTDRWTNESAALAAARAWAKAIVDLSAGWDADGSTGPRVPLSWESVGRVALDYARALLASEAPGQREEGT